MSSAEAQKYEKEQTAKIVAAFEAGALSIVPPPERDAWGRSTRDESGRAAEAFGVSVLDRYSGVYREAAAAGLRAATKLGTTKFEPSALAPALVEFQVGLSKKAAKEVQEWTDLILNGIKNGGVNIDKAVESLWARAKVQAFTVPVIGSVTLSDLRSDVFDTGSLKRAFDDIKWDDVSEQIIAGLAPKGGLADTALKTVNAVRDTLTAVQNIASGIAGLGGVASVLGGAGALLTAAMPYLLVAIALVAIGEAIFDYFDDSEENEAYMKRERATYAGLKDYICDLLYAREKSHYWGTVQMRLDELAWETVVCKRVRGMLKKTDLWKLPRPMGGGPVVWVTMADRHVATARFADESVEPGNYYTDPEWQRLATWSTGEKWPRKGIRQRELLDRRKNDHDFKRVARAAKTANKFLQSVITYLSQEAMTLDDKRVAFELLGIQLLTDASRFSYGLWDSVRPTAYPTNPLPPATGLVKRDNDANPVRPVRPQPAINTLPPQETQALGTKELSSIVSSTSSSPYGQQALEVLATCFSPPVSTFLSSRGASGPLPPRSFVVNRSAATVPAISAPQPSLYLSPLSQVEVAASMMFAGGQWYLAGLSVAPNLVSTSGHKWETVTETLPLGGSVVDWCYRVVFVRFRCGHVSVAAVKVIGIVNDSPELWQKGPMMRDGSLRPPFNTAQGTVFLGANENGLAVDAMTAAYVSPVGKQVLAKLQGSTPWTREVGGANALALGRLVSALPSDAPLQQTGFGATSWSKPLMLGLTAAIGLVAWRATRSHT